MLGAWLDAYFRNGHIWCLYIFFLISGNVATLGLINLLVTGATRAESSVRQDGPARGDLAAGAARRGSPSPAIAGGAEREVGEEMFDTVLQQQNKCTRWLPHTLSGAFRCSAPAECFGKGGAFSAILSAFQWTFQANELRHLFTVFWVSLVRG